MKKHSGLYYSVRFKVKHLYNLVVRLLTSDRYYVCEECKKIHRRDGSECRLDKDESGELMSSRWWYGSVCRKSYNNIVNGTRNLLFDEAFKQLIK